MSALTAFLTVCFIAFTFPANSQILDRSNAETTSNDKDFTGWKLADTRGQGISEYRMAPGAAEYRHYHKKVEHFIRVLEGELSLEMDGVIHALKAGQSIVVPAGVSHEAFNAGPTDLVVLVASTPNKPKDRYLDPLPAGAVLIADMSAMTTEQNPVSSDADGTEEQDLCGAYKLQDLVGQPFDPYQFKGRPNTRVHFPGSMATMDFIESRLNIYVDENDTIIMVRCG